MLPTIEVGIFYSMVIIEFYSFLFKCNSTINVMRYGAYNELMQYLMEENYVR